MPADEQDSLAKDLEAAIAARAELGREYEPALVESFVERLEEAISARVAAEVDRRGSREDHDQGPSFVLGVVSVVMGIPITAIAAPDEGQSLAGLMIVWAGIVGVNLAYALGRRRPR